MFPDIKTAVSNTMFEAEKKIGEALVERARVINSLFDDAYVSCLDGHYASGMKICSEGLSHLDDLLEYADDVMSTADSLSWEFVRDALGTVKMEKAPVQEAIINDYNLRIKRYISPTFGDHPKHYIINEKAITIETENTSTFLLSKNTGRLIEATLDTLGARYHWDKELERWVLDALINPAVAPHLKRYIK